MNRLGAFFTTPPVSYSILISLKLLMIKPMKASQFLPKVFALN
jgi:hypothetical protein